MIRSAVYATLRRLDNDRFAVRIRLSRKQHSAVSAARQNLIIGSHLFNRNIASLANHQRPFRDAMVVFIGEHRKN